LKEAFKNLKFNANDMSRKVFGTLKGKMEASKMSKFCSEAEGEERRGETKLYSKSFLDRRRFVQLYLSCQQPLIFQQTDRDSNIHQDD